MLNVICNEVYDVAKRINKVEPPCCEIQRKQFLNLFCQSFLYRCSGLYKCNVSCRNPGIS